ncbi:MAG: hypothetical protein HKN51_10795, partial [Saprospiraceae bacterium]|nr:hypothetical protein [Saprospiraceae bacterium]
MEQNLLTIFSVFIFLSFSNSLTAQNHSSEKSISHEFITGNWVESTDLNRLKDNDLSDPHPFDQLVVDHFTCLKNEKPFYNDWGNNAVYLEKKDNY